MNIKINKINNRERTEENNVVTRGIIMDTANLPI